MLKLKRILAALLMFTMLFSSMSAMGEEMIELTPEQIAELTGAAEPAESTAEPTPEPAVEAAAEPTAEPTVEPAVEGTVEPTMEPAVEATVEPTAEPTAEPTVEATLEPSAEPISPAQALADTYELSLEKLAAAFDLSVDELTALSAEEIAALQAQLEAMLAEPALLAEGESDFVIDENGVLTAYTGTDAQVVIPNTVTEIGDQAFMGNTTMTSVTIPTSVKKIGKKAFFGCEKLASVAVPGSVESVGESAFYACVAMTEASIADGVKTLGESIFASCVELKSVTIPGSVKNVPSNAFNGCTKLESAELKKGIKEIESYAFNNCNKLNSVIIPEDVTSIGNSAFYNCTSLASITFPTSITEIGWNTFSGCTSLSSVTIPAGVTDISSAFSGCTGLTSITIPEGVTDISSAFSGCTGLTSITIPEGVTDISYAAFRGCTSLTSVTIPEGVTRIDSWAFYGCTGLTSITLPAGLTEIGGDAFSGCTSLTSINIPDGVTRIDSWAFYGCTGLTSVTIPAGVNSIGGGAFSNCSNLTSATVGVSSIPRNLFNDCSKLESIILTRGVKNISDYAFKDYISLKSITIPVGVTSIGNGAFEGCANLTSISIPVGVTSISGYTFSGCTSLASVTIPAGVTDISSAFSGCTSLSSVTIPAGVTDISHAFYGCTGLTSITIPAGVTDISSAFSGCTGLTSITIPEGVASIGEKAFRDCTSLTSITLPKSIMKIETLGGAYGTPFSYCPNLTVYVYRDSYAHTYCEEHNVRYALIDGSAEGCVHVVMCTDPTTCSICGEQVSSIAVTHPASVKNRAPVQLPSDSTKHGWLCDCGEYLSPTAHAEGAPALSTENSAQHAWKCACGKVMRSEDHYVSCTSADTAHCTVCGHAVSMSITHTGVKNTKPVVVPTDPAKHGVYCADCRTYLNQAAHSYADGVCSDCGATEAYTPADDFEIVNGVLVKYKGSAAEVTIPAGVTSIGSTAFQNCKSIVYVTIPDGVIGIGNNAFDSCNNLEDVSFGKDVKSIGDTAFSGCYNLKSVTLPAGVTSIGQYAFYYCSNLSSVTLPASLSSIEFYAFGYCSKLKSVTIPECATSIESNAFSGCSNLTSVTLPDGMTYIGYAAFSGCTRLTNVNIPSSITVIDSNSFYNCSSLTNVVIPEGVKEIGDSAFNGCSGLTSVTIAESVTSIGSGAFANCPSLVARVYENSTAHSYCKDNGISYNIIRIDCSHIVVCSKPGYCVLCKRYTPEVEPQHPGNVKDSAPIPCPDEPGMHGYYCEECDQIVYREAHTTDCTAANPNYCGVCKTTVAAEYEKHNALSADYTVIPDHPDQHGRYCSACKNYLNVGGHYALCEEDGHNCKFCKVELTADKVTHTPGDGYVIDPKHPDQHCLQCSSCGYYYSYEAHDAADRTNCSKCGLLNNKCGDNLTWKLENGTLTISGTGDMWDFDLQGSPWYSEREKIQKLVIEEGVTSIGSYAFEYCSNLPSIEIPESVTSIGGFVFSDCVNFTSITIPDSVTSIGAYAIVGCVNLTSIMLPRSITSIEMGLFEDCTSLESITIPDSVTNIAEFAFAGCKKLASITIPDDVTSIGDYAFAECSNLATITIPKAVTSIGVIAFEECDKLTVLVYENSFAHRFCFSNGIPFKVLAEDISLNRTQIKVKLSEGETALMATVLPSAASQSVKWTSSNEQVVTVSGSVVKLLSAGTAVIRCETTDGTNLKAECRIEVAQDAVKTTLSLDQSSLNMKVGSAVTLKATVEPAASASKLSWTSSNSAVATVSASGKVTAIGAGVAMISCTVNDGSNAQANCIVLVTKDIKVEAITLNRTSATLNLAKEETLPLYEKITPANAADQEVSWTSSNLSVARVSTGGLVTPVGVGTAVISCRSTSNSSVAASCYITVVETAAVEAVELNPMDLTLNLSEGKGAQLSASVLPANASNTSLRWTSSNTSVATVSSSGRVMAVGVGRAVIRCISADNAAAQASCIVEVVNEVGISSITLNKTNVTMNLADHGVCLLSASIQPANATEKELTWKSSNESVAVVTEGGWVIPLSVGRATISCTSESNPSVSASCEVTVVNHVTVTGIVLLDRKLELDWSIGESACLRAMILPSDASDAALLWSSNDEGVATVKNGVVTPVAVGSAVIYCTAASNSSVSAACAVTVYASRKPDAVRIAGNHATSLKLGEEMQLEAALTPANSYSQQEWHSSNEKVAAVLEGGLVKAMGEGSAVISVETDNGKTDSFVLTVIDPTMPTSMEFVDESVQLGAGEEIYLEARVLPVTAKVTLKWESSDSTIVKVNEDGLLKGVKKGSAKIRVTAIGSDGRSFSDIMNVEVKYAPASVTLNKNKLTLFEGGETAKLQASVGTKSASEFTWSSSDESVAIVDENSVIEPMSAGKATIVCETYNGRRASCDVLVSPMPTWIELEETELRMYSRQSLTLKARLMDDSGTEYAGEISFESAQPDVVSVSKSGKVTVKTSRVGTVEIFLTAENGISETALITICKAPNKVELDEKRVVLTVGEKYEVAPIIDEDAATTFSYSSSNKRVASVSKGGIVTANKTGAAKITVRTHNKKSVTLNVKVVAE